MCIKTLVKQKVPTSSVESRTCKKVGIKAREVSLNMCSLNVLQLAGFLKLTTLTKEIKWHLLEKTMFGKRQRNIQNQWYHTAIMINTKND